MKKFKILITVLINLLSSASYAQLSKIEAIASNIDGLIIFTECEPKNDYDILDEISVSSIPPSKISNPPINYLDVRDLYLRTVNKMNLGADGIIFRLNKSGISSAVIIKFIDKTESNNISVVTAIDDLYCFIDSEPASKIEVLGPIVNQYSLHNIPLKIARDGFLKKCNKQFPDADGVIFKFRINAPNSADAIKFL